jgi:TolB protein
LARASYQQRRNDYYPVFSPDGSKIAFVSDRDDHEDSISDIYIMNADGSGLKNLSNNAAYYWNPVFSPDGSEIAFEADLGLGGREIYVMNANGSGLKNLSNYLGEDHTPVWGRSPASF